MSAAIPTATHSGEFRLGSLVLKVHRLDTGQAIIEADSVAAFLLWLENPETTPEEAARFAEEFAAWTRGTR